MLPEVQDLSDHKIVSKEEWLEARKSHLQKELAITRELDRLRAERRALPWVEIHKDYIFAGSEGDVTLADLFDGRQQLAIYHFMLTPGSDHICAGCSFLADHMDAARQHFENADLSLAFVSRAPVSEIEKVKRRMGWAFPWVSSGDGDFNYDLEVSFTQEDRANGDAFYNYGKQKISNSPDMFGVSVFVRPAGGDLIYHTYSTYGRGTELLVGAMNWLDITPLGRNEQGGPQSWLRLHDEY